MDTKKNNKPISTSLLMWFLTLIFFTYQFVLRLFPGLIMADILAKFNIDALQYGILASAYYYGYAGFQIPCAIFLDIYKPKFTLFCCIILCSISSVVFCYTENFYILIISRFFIGVGSAAGFLGVSKIISLWFNKDLYPKMIGLSFTIGLCGAVYGGKPTNLLIEKLGWQQVSLIFAGVSFVISLLVLMFIKSPLEDSTIAQEPSINPSIKDAKDILTSPVIWLLGIGSLLMVGPLEGFADVWGVNYLITAYNLDKSTSAELVSYLFIGMLFGGPLLVYLAKKYGEYNILLSTGILMSLIFMILFYAMPNFNYYVLASLFITLGILCCYQVLIFAIGAELNGISILGVRVAFLNCINMLGGSFFHTIIGELMNNNHNISANNNVAYSLESYLISLSVIPIFTFVGGLIIYLVKYKISNYDIDKKNN